VTKLSLRKYGEHRAENGLHGTSHAAVLRAIKTGLIDKGAKKVGNRWEIDPEIADQEWSELAVSTMQRGDAHRGGRPPKESGPGPLFGENPQVPSVEDDRPAKAGSGMRKALEVQAIYKARLIQIDYERISGKLVESAAVSAAEFSIARTVRDRVLQIPDRISEEMAALDDATEVRSRLIEHLSEALHEITRILSNGSR
jgi:hypothetical protein